MEELLRMEGIGKSFPGVKALDGVKLTVRPGEVHCLMGENGAGKSTLIKILAGIYRKDKGTMFLDGVSVDIRNTHEAQLHGISFIFQELSVVEQLTVEENLTMGNEHHLFGIVNRKANLDAVNAIMGELGIRLDPRRTVGDLSVSQKQMMLIAKALSHKSRLIVMDEPTASLTDDEAESLFRMIDELKDQGVSFVYVSHRFPDIFRIGDRITVFRDGRYVGTVDTLETDESRLISMMVGRDIEDTFPKRDFQPGKTILEVEGLAARDILREVGFTLRCGEILGVSGLAGAGKTELARALFGANPLSRGRIRLHGAAYTARSPREAIAKGIGMVPEERRGQGILSLLSVRENISVAAPKKISRWGIVQRIRDRILAEEYIGKMRIKTPGTEQIIRFLSGGNQQKAVLSKWLGAESEVLLLDEPTRGIDIGAKSEIYQLINDLAAEGKSVIMFSSELPELLGLCDRIMVLREGILTGILSKDEATQEKIMELSIEGGFPK